jgi:cysteine synthase A
MEIEFVDFKMTTPLIKITDKIYAKLETYQPTGSVKDRMVNYIVDDAVRKGKIIPGVTEIIEATSGNTGIALSAAAAKLGCKCYIIMPNNMSVERRKMMKSFGADIIYVEANQFQEAITIRNELLERENSWSPYQFENPLNVECHFKTTAPEICGQLADLELTWSAFVHGSGTGGTMMGMIEYVDYWDIGIDCVLTSPFESAADHGIQGINDGADFLLDKNMIDYEVKVKTEDAIKRMREFAKETGLLVGISSGANLIAAEEYVERYKPEGVVVTMLCDRGERYLSNF